MAYIKTISAAEATGDLAALYKRAGNPDGTVDNVMKIHALNPETLRTHFELYKQCIHRPSPLSRGDREMVQYATKLTMNPQDMDESDVNRLRDAGLDDRSILDLGQCIGYFNYVNRIATGLGVAIGEDEGPIGQWPE